MEFSLGLKQVQIEIYNHVQTSLRFILMFWKYVFSIKDILQSFVFWHVSFILMPRFMPHWDNLTRQSGGHVNSITTYVVHDPLVKV